jgi:CheY-like chemotaxis protein
MAGVLIIDSESAVAKELDDAFKGKGADTHVTGDGSEALQLARSHKPDLIVLCVELSRGSGYSVCNKLKKDAGLSSIPLILTSSQATEETFE